MQNDLMLQMRSESIAGVIGLNFIGLSELRFVESGVNSSVLVLILKKLKRLRINRAFSATGERLGHAADEKA